MTHDIVWWGTYPHAGAGTEPGTGEGVWLQHSADAHLAIDLAAPSFAVVHPSLPLVYAVTEADNSQCHVLDVSDPGQPHVVASMDTGGAGACHVLISPAATTLYISHYVSGDLVVVPLDEEGRFIGDEPAQVLKGSGSGPRHDRQDGPHFHSASLGPGGHHVLVCDLGADVLRRYALRADGLVDDHGVAAELPPGAGPRHLVARGDLLYVTCELDHQLRTLRWDAGVGEAHVVHAVPSTDVAPRSDEDLYDGHVALLTDDVLVVSVRGADVIALFDLDAGGVPQYRASVDAGHWPRHFAIANGRVHVGAERGHEVRTYLVDDLVAVSAPVEPGSVASAPYAAAPLPSPACAVPYHR